MYFAALRFAFRIQNTNKTRGGRVTTPCEFNLSNASILGVVRDIRSNVQHFAITSIIRVIL